MPHTTWLLFVLGMSKVCRGFVKMIPLPSTKLRNMKPINADVKNGIDVFTLRHVEGREMRRQVGQLVRYQSSPLLYVITERKIDGNCVICSLKGSRWNFVDERFLKLIGNNYRSITK